MAKPKSLLIEDKNLSIEYRDINQLIPSARNVRTHSDSQISQLMAIINECGFRFPIHVDQDGEIIAGHGRLLALQRLAETDPKWKQAPVVVHSGLTEIQIRALRLADNQLALNAGYDMELLKLELGELAEVGFDVDLIGFDERQLKDILEVLPAGGMTDPDAVPQPGPAPHTVMGDVWLLGNHRVKCGDAADLITVEDLMRDKKADLIFTDPPYGIKFEHGASQTRPKKGAAFEPIENDDLQGEALKDFIRTVMGNAYIFSDDKACLYAWSDAMRRGLLAAEGIFESGWKLQSQIIWNKNNFSVGAKDYHQKHEVCWYAFKPDIKGGHNWYGDRDKSTVWDVPKMQSIEFHPTQKPTKLAEMALENNTKVGDIVLDLFGGSGSTLIACEMLKRHGYLMEIEPVYCDVIVRRWQNFTGETAILESTNQPFPVPPEVDEK